MKNLFETATANEVKARIGRLGPGSERQWGKMSAPQALEHCSRSMELAFGERKPPRAPAGWMIGWAIKPLVFKDDQPFRRNSPTIKELVVVDEPNLELEKEKLSGLIDRFAAGGPGCCTDHPHSFFGRLTPEQWAILMYKHLDHHLRQVGV
jgi:hypothetical protein